MNYNLKNIKNLTLKNGKKMLAFHECRALYVLTLELLKIPLQPDPKAERACACRTELDM